MYAIARTQNRTQQPMLRAIWLFAAGAILLLAQTLTAAAQGLPNSFADLAERISPSVVNITTQTVVARAASDAPQQVVPEGSPFEDFFKEFQDRRSPERGPRRSSALGSGFVISEDGFIVTNNHVIEGADEIMIEFFNGEELPAELVGTDPNTDIAVLKVTADEPLPFVSFGDSDTARVGDWVIAMGNPLGQGFSVSAGIVSARSRELSGPYDDYIQTDAAINRGNSGGPLFNINGDVVGVNTAILSPNGGSIGIGFSMASNVVTRVVDQLQEFGETRRGWLGVSIQDVTEDIASGIEGLDTAAGALVTNVPDGPAKDGGILTGDVIITFDGTDVEDVRELVGTVGNTLVGKAVRVVVVRNGATETLLITLGRRETAEAAQPAAAEAPEPTEDEPMQMSDFGITLSNLNDDIREGLDLDADAEGVVVVAVDEDSEAFEKGLRTGDLITEAGQAKVTTLQEFEGAVTAARDGGRKSLLLLIRRQGNPRFIALGLDE
ncbi:MAG: Do family serine endopeptidase [Planktomarina sp.]